MQNLQKDIRKEELAQYFLLEHDKLKGNLKQKEFFTPYWCWLGLTFLGMGLIFEVAFSVYDSKQGHDLDMILSRLPLFTILIWFTWFCSKQFSYTKQICDEYEYKYALSKSYLSYKDEANKLAQSAGKDVLLASLLDAVIKNISTSPVQSVKTDCHTPFAEALKAFDPIINKVEKQK